MPRMVKGTWALKKVDKKQRTHWENVDTGEVVWTSKKHTDLLRLRVHQGRVIMTLGVVVEDSQQAHPPGWTASS